MKAGLEPRERLDKRLLASEPARAARLALPPHADQIVEILRTPRSLAELTGVSADAETARAAVTVLVALGIVRLL
jgi:hypothetical protein